MRPDHIAIIMDGNGRWAKKRGRERFFGHVRGSKTAKKVVEQCRDLGISYVTLYAFSTENWGRPVQEVQFLMRLLSRHLRKEKATLIKNNIQFKCIGNLNHVPKDLASEIQDCVRMTSANTGMTLTFALSYGGRQEIAMAAQRIAEKVAAGELETSNISEETVAEHLQTYPMPDPDLVIRTSGESRLSNFLPWQTAYSEIYVTDTLWPDFDEQELKKALDDFACRRRRFGKLDETSKPQLRPSSSAAVL